MPAASPGTQRRRSADAQRPGLVAVYRRWLEEAWLAGREVARLAAGLLAGLQPGQQRTWRGG